MAELQDDDTLTRAIQGDQEAFGTLYEQYVGRIFNYIYYRTGNVYDAEDLTERVFLRALRHIRHYDHRGLPFSAWLYRIAHNLVANWHRDNSRRQVVSIDDLILTGSKREDPVAAAEEKERQSILLRAIRKLPPERQELLILKFTEQMSNAEIARVMGRTEGAIKSLYHRTLVALREELQGVLEWEEPGTEEPS